MLIWYVCNVSGFAILWMKQDPDILKDRSSKFEILDDLFKLTSSIVLTFFQKLTGQVLLVQWTQPVEPVNHHFQIHSRRFWFLVVSFFWSLSLGQSFLTVKITISTSFWWQLFYLFSSLSNFSAQPSSKRFCSHQKSWKNLVHVFCKSVHIIGIQLSHP